MKILLLVLFACLFSYKQPVFSGGGDAVITQIPEKSSYGLDNIQENNNIPNNLDVKDTINLVLGGIIGFVSGLGSVKIVEKLKEPNIVFEVGTSRIDTMQGQNRKSRFVHIKITNYDKKPFFFKKILPSTNVAFSTKTILVVNDNRKKRKFVGRWSNHPQYLPKMLSTSKGTVVIPDVNALVHGREDIHPQPRNPKSEIDESKEIVVGLKYEGESEFYLFNNESYFHTLSEFKNVESKFDKGVYKGYLHISTMGFQKIQPFKIYNNSSNLSDFRITLS